MTDDKRKKMSWTYSLVSHVMEAVFPTGEKKSFDLTNLVVGMVSGQELMFYYGCKQWLASNAAAFKGAAEKIMSFAEDFKGLMEHGIELAGEGQISIIGKVTRKAPKTQDAAVLPKMSTYTDEQITSIKGALDMGLIVLSEEVKAQVLARFQAIKPAAGKKH